MGSRTGPPVQPMTYSAMLAALLIGVGGSILQIGGSSWDITSHLMNKPETFFTPSHSILYSGVGLETIAASIGGVVLFKNKQIRGRSVSTAFKLLMAGTAIELVAGPSDFWWHSTFGIDGLLSPPHLTLGTGILANAIAIPLGLARIGAEMQSNQRLVKAAMVPAFAALWYTMVWYIFIFALPISNGQHFRFNLDPVSETIIAIAGIPIVSSIVFLTASRAIGRFGAASAVVAVVLAMNILADILPPHQIISSVSWYPFLIIPAIAADFILSRAQSNPAIGNQVFVRSLPLIAGAIIGSLFYLFNFPMLPMTFENMLGKPYGSFNTALPIFYESLSQVLALTVIPGALVGFVGAIVALKKIKIPVSTQVVLKPVNRDDVQS